MNKVDTLNHVVNRPEVLAGCAPGYYDVDMTAFFEEPRNVMIGDKRGVVLFAYLGDFTYEMHYLLTDALRGRAAFRLCRKALDTMFTKHHASAICGATPRENRAARAMNRALGAVPVGVSTDSMGRACINYRLERTTWATLSAAS